MKILVVEDEPRVASFLTRGLNELGYGVSEAADGRSASELFSGTHFDLVILDLVLPDISGLELCKTFKEVNPGIPVIMLTALGTLQNKLEGFESGADDYLVKPFEFRELAARIQAHIRKASNPEAKSRIMRTGEVELDLDKKTARRENRDILLSAKEFALLELLMSNPGKVLSRGEIAHKVWDINFDTGTNVVDVYINMLRKKIDRDFKSKYIHTRIGLGYIFQEE